MEIKEIVGAGVLVAGVAAGMAMGQNQLQISGSGKDLPPVQGTTAAESGSSSSGTSGAGSGTRAGFVDTGPLKLNRLNGNEYSTGLLLYNPHCTTESVALSAQLLDRHANPVAVTLTVDGLHDESTAEKTGTQAADNAASRQWDIPAGAYERRFVRIAPVRAPDARAADSGLFGAMRRALSSSPAPYGDWTGHLPAKGVLILTRYTPPSKSQPKGESGSDKDADDQCRTKAQDARTARRELTLQPPLPSTVDTGIVLAALALAVGATGVAAGVIFVGSRRKPKTSKVSLSSQMDRVAFDFGKSWATNVAVFGAIVTALTNTAILSQDQYSSNATTYVILSGLFPVLLVPLGGMLHGLIRPPSASNAQGQQAQTYVAVYLISTALVLWGAFGQLLVVGMLFRELELARVLAREPSVTLILLSKAAIVMLFVYAVMTALETVNGGNRTTETTSETARPALRHAAMI